jgi:hypothetical protein
MQVGSLKIIKKYFLSSFSFLSLSLFLPDVGIDRDIDVLVLLIGFYLLDDLVDVSHLCHINHLRKE